MNSETIEAKIKTKSHLYNILSRIYYLPAYSSKAITKDYLLKYTQKEIPIFYMKREGMSRHNFQVKKYNSSELLDMLDDLLKNGKKPSTGLSSLTIPDQEWLLNAILNVDPTDKFGLFDSVKDKRNELHY